MKKLRSFAKKNKHGAWGNGRDHRVEIVIGTSQNLDKNIPLVLHGKKIEMEEVA